MIKLIEKDRMMVNRSMSIEFHFFRIKSSGGG